MFNPNDWYWKKADGKVYSSARQKLYSASNADYKAWLASGNIPTQYPRDIEGNDSDAELASVLSAYGLKIWEPDGKAAAISRLTASCAVAIIGGYSSSALGSPHIYPSGVTDQINMMGSVTASILPGLDPEWTTPFWCSDETGEWAFRMHSIVQIRDAGSDGKLHVVACQTLLEQLTAQIFAAETDEEISEIVWPVDRAPPIGMV